MKAWKYGYTQSLLKRPSACPFTAWQDMQNYLRGYMYGEQMKKDMGI